MSVDWTAIFARIKAWIDILVTRAYQVQEWIKPYIKAADEEESTTGA